MIQEPLIFKKFPLVSAAQSTRKGGISLAPFESLNLGKSVGDKIENVEKNREIFFRELGFEKSQAVFSHQIHDAQILLVDQPGDFTGFDAQITNQKNICLAVSIADCTPILIYDAKNEAIAAIHAGWKGTVATIVTKTLQAMQLNFGSQGKHCFAYIGTCISFENFEVNADVSDHFLPQFKQFDSLKNKYFVDLKAANKAQLLAFGLPEEHLEISEYCTVGNNDLFFSHRFEKGNTGRMLAGIGMKINE